MCQQAPLGATGLMVLQQALLSHLAVLSSLPTFTMPQNPAQLQACFLLLVAVAVGSKVQTLTMVVAVVAVDKWFMAHSVLPPAQCSQQQ
jgi:hypothetical protein